MQIAKLLPLLFAAMFLVSCQNPFRPPLKDISTPDIQNRSPEEVLNNLAKSYKEKNINLFKTLLHSNFRFELMTSEVNQIGLDLDGDGFKDTWWGYEQEVEFTNNMFNFGSSDGTYPVADVIDLRLQVPPQQSWEIDPTVGREDWVVIPCYFDLTLTYNSFSTSYIASGRAWFYLRPEGNRWYIAIWRDESNL